VKSQTYVFRFRENWNSRGDNGTSFCMFKFHLHHKDVLLERSHLFYDEEDIFITLRMKPESFCSPSDRLCDLPSF
jgi:hypothetical protein